MTIIFIMIKKKESIAIHCNGCSRRYQCIANYYYKYKGELK